MKRADRLSTIQTNVWVEFIQLAGQYRPVNLGQGFPDFAAPEHLSRALAEAVVDRDRPLINQYTRDAGHPRLVRALSQLYSGLTGLSIDPDTDILVTSGAYQALYCAFMAYVNPGDEVLIIEPFFDCYEPMTLLAGGTPVFVPLRPKPGAPGAPMSSADWRLDPEELEAAFSAKTKFIIVNTPNNPLGKIYTRDELELIARLCKKYDCLAVMDEVYEWMVYTGSTHTRMCSLPDMWDRTITIGSGGKTFSVTGWKLGWAYGPQHLLDPLYLIHQSNVSSCPTPIQEALAVGFERELQRMGTPDSYWAQLSQSLESKRNRISKFLTEADMSPTLPEGGYFIIADFSRLADRIDLSGEKDATKDYRFAKWLTKNAGLQGIPTGAFYSSAHKHLAENYIRFCFIKKDETLDKAEQIITGLNNRLPFKRVLHPFPTI
ncbi:unnamed protein product [Oppiella nova]|uniref:Aminotransferase class I/classII large domain-containing protein n=1 Tax=Oppiella nova TaxID=334625 RepID=A0A7R9QAB4_9ACAR|nr:unnamed protein product [Oppiella nova]CAG2160485.1 unnamed protein product [Oppiella nova]